MAFLRQGRSLNLVGAIITAIGLITLPDDIAMWIDRLGGLVEAVRENPISGLAALIGIVILLFANRDMLSRMFGARRWRTDIALGDELNQWLRRARYQMQDIRSQDLEDPSRDTLSFGFVARMGGRAVAVMKLVGEPGVRLQAEVIVTDEENHRQIIQNMNKQQRDALLEDIGIELARSGLGFAVRDLIENGVRIVHGIIPSESMTQYQFLSHVGLVERAILLVQLIVRRHVRLANAAASEPILATTAIPQLIGPEDTIGTP